MYVFYFSTLKGILSESISSVPNSLNKKLEEIFEISDILEEQHQEEPAQPEEQVQPVNLTFDIEYITKGVLFYKLIFYSGTYFIYHFLQN